MALDVTFGSLTQEEADRLGQASVMPVDAGIASLAVSDHVPGATEPWVSRLVGDFVVATGARTVLETGCFTGATSVYIQDALYRLGGGTYWLCDIDPQRLKATERRLEQHPFRLVSLYFRGDVMRVLQSPDTPRFDLAFVDDEHTKPHVTKELMLLIPRMNPGGLILLHDVYGVTDLQEVVRQFGGYSIKLPRLGPAGGLGCIQCP